MRLSAFHPLTALVYFAAVLAVTMFCFSPAVGICSAVGAFLFCAITQSCRQTASDLAFYIFLTAVLTVTNPLFSHKGVTPLFFVNGKAYTKEALFYGLTAGLSLTAVIMWCKALGKVLTREKLLYIFGRKTPKAALVITMTMGFIPKLKRLHRQLLDALNCSGANISDSIFMAVFAVIFALVLIFSARGELSAAFYPVIKLENSVLPVGMFALLCIFPFILEVKESIKWKYCLAKM